MSCNLICQTNRTRKLIRKKIPRMRNAFRNFAKHKLQSATKPVETRLIFDCKLVTTPFPRYIFIQERILSLSFILSCFALNNAYVPSPLHPLTNVVRDHLPCRKGWSWNNIWFRGVGNWVGGDYKGVSWSQRKREERKLKSVSILMS